MSALAGTISAPFTVDGSSIALGRWLRAGLSLALAVGILAIALPVAFSSGATATGADPLRAFSSGSLVSIDAEGGAQLSVAGIVPGQSRAATVRIANSGDAPVAFSLAASVVDRVGPGGASLSEALELRIESTAGRLLYDGPIGRLDRLGLGNVAAGSARAYRFVVALPASVGNEVAGSSLSAGFTWNASS